MTLAAAPDCIGKLARLRTDRLRRALVLDVRLHVSGLASPGRKATVAFMKLGAAVGLLGRIPWLQGAAVRYWGDIDTHGFAILDQARAVLPGLRSLLMDRETLLRHRRLWVEDTATPPAATLDRLTPAEREVYEGLVAGTWGIRVRLEQERIPWAEVLAVLD